MWKYICWRQVCLIDCVIWSAALCVIRSRVSEESTIEQFNECEKWINMQPENHWRLHLRQWLKYVSERKIKEWKEHKKSLKVEEALKQFYGK